MATRVGKQSTPPMMATTMGLAPKRLAAVKPTMIGRK
jgi:hypothetical protein